MGKLSDKEKYDILCKQEEELRFEHFDNDDAWKLGKILVKKAKVLAPMRSAVLPIARYPPDAER